MDLRDNRSRQWNIAILHWDYPHQSRENVDNVWGYDQLYYAPIQWSWWQNCLLLCFLECLQYPQNKDLNATEAKKEIHLRSTSQLQHQQGPTKSFKYFHSPFNNSRNARHTLMQKICLNTQESLIFWWCTNHKNSSAVAGKKFFTKHP